MVLSELNAAVPSDSKIAKLYERYQPGAFNLPDQGYIARAHPLELWLVRYLLVNPQATLSEALAASAAERQEVYKWLFKTKTTLSKPPAKWGKLLHKHKLTTLKFLPLLQIRRAA